VTPEPGRLVIPPTGRSPTPTAPSIWAATTPARTAEEAFQGVLAGTKLSLAVRKLRLIRPDVAVVDLDARVSGMPVPPPDDSNAPGGEVRISQMLVLVQEDDRWWITAQHNAMQSAGD
jgi:uncharacterized protein (TIGR02246 family)